MPMLVAGSFDGKFAPAASWLPDQELSCVFCRVEESPHIGDVFRGLFEARRALKEDDLSL